MRLRRTLRFRLSRSPSPASPEPDTTAMGAGEGGWRARAEQAEARLAEIAGHVRDRLNAPGRAGMSRMAAGIILGIAEGSEGETGNHA